MNLVCESVLHEFSVFELGCDGLGLVDAPVYGWGRRDLKQVIFLVILWRRDRLSLCHSTV